jgi:hypothetical protein
MQIAVDDTLVQEAVRLSDNSPVEAIATVLNDKERSDDAVVFNDFVDEVVQKLDEAETALVSGVAPLDAGTVFQRLRASHGY